MKNTKEDKAVMASLPFDDPFDSDTICDKPKKIPYRMPVALLSLYPQQKIQKPKDFFQFRRGRYSISHNKSKASININQSWKAPKKTEGVSRFVNNLRQSTNITTEVIKKKKSRTYSLMGVNSIRFKRNIANTTSYSEGKPITKIGDGNTKLINFSIRPIVIQDKKSSRIIEMKLKTTYNSDDSFTDTLNSSNNEENGRGFYYNLKENKEEIIQEADLEESPKKLK